MGGELYSVLERQGTVHPVAAKFYAGCLVSVFEHLHQRRIVYRDLKPENVLIDAQGYPKLIDFGFGKVLQQRTRSTCGTPDYFAPEILQGRGYLWSVDWWCVGVLIYEMLFGGTPFEADSAMDMFKNILTEEPEVEETTGNGFPISDECRDVVLALLKKDPNERLVSYRSPDGEGVRKAAWFQTIDFEHLLKKEVPAPWTPSLSSPTDTSNFDEYDDDDLDPEPEDDPTASEVEWDF